MNGKVLNDNKADWRELLDFYLFPGSVAYVWSVGLHYHTVAKNLDHCEFQLICKSYGINKISHKEGVIIIRRILQPCWYAVREGHRHNWQGNRKQAYIMGRL